MHLFVYLYLSINRFNPQKLWHVRCTLTDKGRNSGIGESMRILKLKGIEIFGGIALIMLVGLVGLASDVSAQSRRDIDRERERYERQQREYERQDRRRQNRNRRQAENDTYFPNSRGGGMSPNTRMGYEQGLIAGQFDARKRKYNNSNVYRNTGLYPNGGDPTSADYLYRQAYLRGYEDGYNGRRNY